MNIASFLFLFISPIYATFFYYSLFVELQVSKVNLIMTDYSMPGITGYDLLKRIKVG